MAKHHGQAVALIRVSADGYKAVIRTEGGTVLRESAPHSPQVASAALDAWAKEYDAAGWIVRTSK